ncbi:MAG: hypothetical protein ACYDEC_00415 [Bacteroidia bacterium]
MLAPYKESVSVYGLLNQSDTIHYIRIERIFLGEGNAYTMAQNQDSVYFKSGELKVSLQRWNKSTGQQVSVDVPVSSSMEIILTDTLIQADAGIFNQNERVYKTNHKLYADTNYQYKLIIHNNKTGKEYTAQTGLVSNFQLAQVLGNTLSQYLTSSSFINIVPYGLPGVICQYNSPANAGVCGLTLRLFYTEYNGGGAPKYIDLGLGTYYPSTTFGGETQKFDYLGASMLSYIAASVPVNPSVTRSADSVEFLLTAGGPDLALYNQVNASTSLSQNAPNYTNISGGIGVFSSRYQLALGRKLTEACLDTLSSSSLTCKLRFLNYNHTLSPCN